ncbi:MAG: hypothetical protein ACRDK3_08585 [Actinomycetota bacterium]
MRRLTPPAAIIGAALLTAGSVGMVVVGSTTERRARDSLTGALQLYDARLQVADAQRSLGEVDLEDAVDQAGEANAVARRVGKLTNRLAATLGPTEKSTRTVVALAARGTRSTIVTRRQTQIARKLLGAISSYQSSASSSAARTNHALRRILRSLRAINDDFPGPP